MEIGGEVFERVFVEDPSKDYMQLQCEECFEVFVCEKGLSAHWRQAHGPKLYPCKVCRLKFILPSILKKHTEAVHNKDTIKTPYPCNFCKGQFSTEELLKRHHDFVHPINNNYSCGHCGRGFKSRRGLRYHIEDQHIIYYNSGIENILTKTILKKQLDQHENSQTNYLLYAKDSKESEETLETTSSHAHSFRHVCGTCGKVFSSSAKLRKHTNMHTFNYDSHGDTFDCDAIHNSEHIEERRYLCTVCDKRFKERSYLTTHLKHHTDEKTYFCETCDRGFITSADLDRHSCSEPFRRVHAIISTPSNKPVEDERKHNQYKCPTCPRNCLSEELLKEHIARYHSSHVCEKCGKVSKSFWNLKDHMLVHDEEARKFACTLCDKRFKRNADLTMHVRVHTGERPHVCEVCARSFINKSNLKNHLCRVPCESNEITSRCSEQSASKSKEMRISHNPHVCEKCGKVLSSKDSLREHMNRHNGVKPFACGICGIRFVRRHALGRHLMVHTGERPFLCDRCSRGFTTSTKLKDHKCRALQEESSGITSTSNRKPNKGDRIQ